jgi:hypothetical protein
MCHRLSAPNASGGCSVSSPQRATPRPFVIPVAIGKCEARAQRKRSGFLPVPSCPLTLHAKAKASQKCPGNVSEL